jgi:Pyridoxal-dependent decarboxylase conserved domain/Aldehyde dehydrogenase family
MLSSSKARNPLDLNGSDFSALMKDVVRLLAEFLDHLPNAPFIQHADRFELLRDPFMRPAPSESGRPLRELLEIISRAADNDLNTASGSALSAIPGSGLVSSAAADLISGVLNRYTGLKVGAPAMVAMEADVLRWMADLLGLPPTAAGILTSGGSMAVFSAIVCARSTKLPEDFRRGVIYATNQTHHALAKAVRLAGFPDDALQLVAVDSKLRMDVSALQAAIARDRDAGRFPFCISANAGTTNTGTIDPLPELAQITNDEGLWYHVDAAYGGFFQLTKRGRERLTGIEHADSVVLDPHKGLFVPFGTGCLLVRTEEVLRHSHSGGDAPYLHSIHELRCDLRTAVLLYENERLLYEGVSAVLRWRAKPAIASATKVGDGFDPQTRLGPVQNQLQYKRLQSVWEEIKRSGAKVLFRGGVPTNTEGLFFPVTLLDNPPDGSSFVTQEVFGPIRSIFKYKNLEEAIRRANDTSYGRYSQCRLTKRN